MSVNIAADCGAFTMSQDFVLTSREPLPYTKKVVNTTNAGGYPLTVTYYYGDDPVFTTVQTYNAQNIETSWEVFKA